MSPRGYVVRYSTPWGKGLRVWRDRQKAIDDAVANQMLGGDARVFAVTGHEIETEIDITKDIERARSMA